MKQTPLNELHKKLGAKMVPFAGYEMPVHYAPGILAEHRQVRASAGLFDVSHMGQARVLGSNAGQVLETVLPANLLELDVGLQRYSFFTDANGGILDDLMVARLPDSYHLVVNASNKTDDFLLLESLCKDNIEFRALTDHALLALQGPQASAVLETLAPGINALPFMGVQQVSLKGLTCTITRSGYTGEDGYEISVAAENALALATTLLESPKVTPAGLGARDSLRLEAGLCLHGNDIGPDTSPVEAGLQWAIPQCRRKGGSRSGGFPGADRILSEIEHGPVRKRVGICPQGRAPVRAHTSLLAPNGSSVGKVTSGGFGPSINAPVAMAYVAREFSTPGTALQAVVRNRPLPVQVCPLPFVPHRYYSPKTLRRPLS